MLLHWEIIKWAKHNGHTKYDLHGFPEPSGRDDPLYGVCPFKRGWGGELLRLVGEYDYSPYPLLGKLMEWKISRS